MNIKKPLNSFQIRKRFFKDYKLITMNLFQFFQKKQLNDPTVKIFKRLFDIIFRLL
jgi:hypothetical protein